MIERQRMKVIDEEIAPFTELNGPMKSSMQEDEEYSLIYFPD